MWSRAGSGSVCYLHGQESGQVNLRYGLGSLPLPHAALSVFWHFRVLAALHQVPETQTLLLLTFQHRCLCSNITTRNHSDASKHSGRSRMCLTLNVPHLIWVPLNVLNIFMFGRLFYLPVKRHLCYKCSVVQVQDVVLFGFCVSCVLTLSSLENLIHSNPPGALGSRNQGDRGAVRNLQSETLMFN